ncbi:MAG: phosphatase PAP2 family protein [Actinomycetota bacterium]
MSVQAEVAQPQTRARLPWLREAIVLAVVYVVYGLVRNRFGSAHLHGDDAPLHAFNNAVRVIHLEKTLGLFHEPTIQRWFLGTPFIAFFNIFYGTAHFVVTLGVLIWLFVRRHHVFARWRTTLVATTVVALFGFALFPLMPPRLVNTPPSQSRYGGGQLAVDRHLPNYGFVDTLRDGDGLWSFDSQGMDDISNQYAAMPSLHIGWSLWCMLVLWRFSRRRISRLIGLAYPVLTLIAIVATANHFIIDAAGGIAIVVVGSLVAHLVERVQRNRAAAANAEPRSSSDVVVGH